jgi:hypothetical protein
LLLRLKERGVPGTIEPADGTVGGGAAPDKTFPTKVVALQPADAGAFLARLRAAEPAVIPRVERDVVMVDVRTVLGEETETLVDTIAKAWA